MNRTFDARDVFASKRERQDVDYRGVESLSMGLPLPIGEGAHVPKHVADLIEGIGTGFVEVAKHSTAALFETIRINILDSRNCSFSLLERNAVVH